MKKVSTVLYILGPIFFVIFVILMTWLAGQHATTPTEMTDPADQLEVAPYEELPYGP